MRIGDSFDDGERKLAIIPREVFRNKIDARQRLVIFLLTIDRLNHERHRNSRNLVDAGQCVERGQVNAPFNARNSVLGSLNKFGDPFLSEVGILTDELGRRDENGVTPARKGALRSKPYQCEGPLSACATTGRG